jgi:hypothetical protein
MKEFIDYAKSIGIKSIDIDALCLISTFLKKQESKQSSLNGVVKSLPQDNYCQICNLPTDGEKCFSKRCPI